VPRVAAQIGKQIVPRETFARRVFLIAGIYGLIVMLPQYFLEGKIGRDYPPPITHVEYFYGFVGVTIAWQLVFLVMSRDPVRYRPIMIPAMVEKATWAVASVALFALGRLSTEMLAAGLIDALLGTLFFVSYVRTRAGAASRDARTRTA
jgi:hypothetical protein